jgi:hypothetical protein
MKRRRLLVVLGVPLAVLILVDAVWCLTPPRPGITSANCARIRVGMRRAEVEAILGGPPGYYHGGRLVSRREDPFESLYGTMPAWAGDEGTVYVRFSRDGNVRNCAEFVDFRPAWEPTQFQRLLASVRRRILGR